jgi:DNA polymerase-4
MHSITRRGTLHATIAATGIVTEIAEDLVRVALDDHIGERWITLLAISVSHLVYQPVLQLELNMGLRGEARRPGTKRGASRWMADKAMDKVRGRFGWDAIGYANVVLEGVRSVPDGFRELAEKNL